MAAVQIATSGNFGTPTSNKNFIGPIRDSSGNYWVFGFTGQGGTTLDFKCYKSTDGGATWGTSYTSTSFTAGTVGANCDVVYDGSDKFYILARNSSAQYSIYTFTISTTTWALFDSATNRPAATTTDGGNYPAYLVRRSTGEFVVFYQGPQHNSMGTNYDSVYVARCSSSGVWTAGVEVDAGGTSNFYAKGACLGASDRVHMLYASGSSPGVLHRSLDSTNTLSTADTINSLSSVSLGYSITYDATLAKVLIYYWDTVMRGASSATPGWSQDTGTTSASGQGNPVNGSLVYWSAKSNLYVVYRDSSTSDIFINSAPSSGVAWGTGAIQDVATSPAYISAALLGSAGIGIVYRDTNYYFDIYTSAGPKAVTPAGISATSTVSGAIGLKPRVTAGNVAATSTISASPLAGIANKTVFYMSSTPSTLVATANKISLNGIASTSKNNLLNQATGWGEYWSQGNAAAWPAAGSQPAFGSGQRGWIFEPTGLEGLGLSNLAGNFSLEIVAFANNTVTADCIVRFGKRSSAGVYTEMFAYTFAGLSLTNSIQRFTASNIPVTTPIEFDVGDKLYVEIDWHILTNTTSGTVQLTMYEDGTQAGLYGLWFTAFVGPVAVPLGTNVNATSTISGSVRRLAKVTPAGISATSTVSGSTRTQRAVVPAQVAATSTVSGAVRATRKVAGAISATSTISGRIGRRYALGVSGQLTLAATGAAPLDNFNRAGTTTPPSANWSKLYMASGSVDLALAGDSDSVISPVNNPATVSADYWNPSVFGPDSEVFVDIKELDMADDNQFTLFARGSNMGLSTKTCYILEWYPDGFSMFSKIVAGAQSQVGPASQMGGTGQNNLNNGDSIGMQVIGSGTVVTLIAWYKGPSGFWYPLNVVQDTAANRITAAGNIGVSMYGFNTPNPSQAITNFYGGTSIASLINAVLYARSTVGGVVTKAGGPKPIPPSAAISATSAISGSVAPLRKVAPAAISATSTVSGSTRVTRAVKPVQISATSTVSGSLVAQRKIIPAGISATSTISGALAPKRGILPAGIAATSIVSGAVRATHKVAGAISATSTVNGTVQKGPVKAITGNVAATSSVAGSIQKGPVKFIGGSGIAAQSAISGAVVPKRGIVPAAISATSTVSGQVTATRKVAGGISATSTISGSVKVLRGITPVTVFATSTVSGITRATHAVAGVVTATSSISGTVIIGAKKAVTPAQISATSTVSGFAGVRRGIFPVTVAATSTVSGVTQKGPAKPIAGAISAPSTISGSIRVIHVLTGNVINATSTISGKTVTIRRLVFAGISATSTVSGAIIRIPAGKVFFGNITATSTITGGFVRRAAVAGALLATSTVSGALRALRGVTGGVVQATSTVSGVIQPRRGILPVQIAATSVVSGAVRVTRKITPVTISATSAIAGAFQIGGKKAISGVVAATSTISGLVTVRRKITPVSVAATSTVSGFVTKIGVPRPIAPAQVLATSTITGAIGRRRPVIGANVLATSTITGSLKFKRAFFGAISAQSTITGHIGRVLHRGGAITATSTIQGSILRVKPVPSAAILATAQVSGVIQRKPYRMGDIWATSTISGSIVATYPVWGYTKPQITSIGDGKPRLIATANGKTILERVRVL